MDRVEKIEGEEGGEKKGELKGEVKGDEVMSEVKSEAKVEEIKTEAKAEAKADSIPEVKHNSNTQEEVAQTKPQEIQPSVQIDSKETTTQKTSSEGENNTADQKQEDNKKDSEQNKAETTTIENKATKEPKLEVKIEPQETKPTESAPQSPDNKINSADGTLEKEIGNESPEFKALGDLKYAADYDKSKYDLRMIIRNTDKAEEPESKGTIAESPLIAPARIAPFSPEKRETHEKQIFSSPLVSPKHRVQGKTIGKKFGGITPMKVADASPEEKVKTYQDPLAPHMSPYLVASYRPLKQVGIDSTTIEKLKHSVEITEDPKEIEFEYRFKKEDLSDSFLQILMGDHVYTMDEHGPPNNGWMALACANVLKHFRISPQLEIYVTCEGLFIHKLGQYRMYTVKTPVRTEIKIGNESADPSCRDAIILHDSLFFYINPDNRICLIDLAEEIAHAMELREEELGSIDPLYITQKSEVTNFLAGHGDILFTANADSVIEKRLVASPEVVVKTLKVAHFFSKEVVFRVEALASCNVGVNPDFVCAGTLCKEGGARDRIAFMSITPNGTIENTLQLFLSRDVAAVLENLKNPSPLDDSSLDNSTANLPDAPLPNTDLLVVKLTTMHISPKFDLILPHFNLQVGIRLIGYYQKKLFRFYEKSYATEGTRLGEMQRMFADSRGEGAYDIMVQVGEKYRKIHLKLK
jgi:hypothetical protein